MDIRPSFSRELSFDSRSRVSDLAEVLRSTQRDRKRLAVQTAQQEDLIKLLEAQLESSKFTNDRLKLERDQFEAEWYSVCRELLSIPASSLTSDSCVSYNISIAVHNLRRRLRASQAAGVRQLVSSLRTQLSSSFGVIRSSIFSATVHEASLSRNTHVMHLKDVTSELWGERVLSLRVFGKFSMLKFFFVWRTLTEKTFQLVQILGERLKFRKRQIIFNGWLRLFKDSPVKNFFQFWRIFVFSRKTLKNYFHKRKQKNLKIRFWRILRNFSKSVFPNNTKALRSFFSSWRDKAKGSIQPTVSYPAEFGICNFFNGWRLQVRETTTRRFSVLGILGIVGMGEDWLRATPFLRGWKRVRGVRGDLGRLRLLVNFRAWRKLIFENLKNFHEKILKNHFHAWRKLQIFISNKKLSKIENSTIIEKAFNFSTPRQNISHFFTSWRLNCHRSRPLFNLLSQNFKKGFLRKFLVLWFELSKSPSLPLNLVLRRSFQNWRDEVKRMRFMIEKFLNKKSNGLLHEVLFAWRMLREQKNVILSISAFWRKPILPPIIFIFTAWRKIANRNRSILTSLALIPLKTLKDIISEWRSLNIQASEKQRKKQFAENKRTENVRKTETLLEKYSLKFSDSLVFFFIAWRKEIKIMKTRKRAILWALRGQGVNHHEFFISWLDLMKKRKQYENRLIHSNCRNIKANCLKEWNLITVRSKIVGISEKLALTFIGKNELDLQKLFGSWRDLSKKRKIAISSACRCLTSLFNQTLSKRLRSSFMILKRRAAIISISELTDYKRLTRKALFAWLQRKKTKQNVKSMKRVAGAFLRGSELSFTRSIYSEWRHVCKQTNRRHEAVKRLAKALKHPRKKTMREFMTLLKNSALIDSTNDKVAMARRLARDTVARAWLRLWSQMVSCLTYRRSAAVSLYSKRRQQLICSRIFRHFVSLRGQRYAVKTIGEVLRTALVRATGIVAVQATALRMQGLAVEALDVAEQKVVAETVHRFFVAWKFSALQDKWEAHTASLADAAVELNTLRQEIKRAASKAHALLG